MYHNKAYYYITHNKYVCFVHGRHFCNGILLFHLEWGKKLRCRAISITLMTKRRNVILVETKIMYIYIWCTSCLYSIITLRMIYAISEWCSHNIYVSHLLLPLHYSLCATNITWDTRKKFNVWLLISCSKNLMMMMVMERNVYVCNVLWRLYFMFVCNADILSNGMTWDIWCVSFG